MGSSTSPRSTWLREQAPTPEAEVDTTVRAANAASTAAWLSPLMMVTARPRNPTAKLPPVAVQTSSCCSLQGGAGPARARHARLVAAQAAAQAPLN